MALFPPTLIATKRNPKAVANPSHILKFATMHPTDDGGTVDSFEFCYLGWGQKFLHTSSMANRTGVVNELLVELVAFVERQAYRRFATIEREGGFWPDRWVSSAQQDAANPETVTVLWGLYFSPAGQWQEGSIRIIGPATT